jgi:hypothetical protein
MSLGNYFKSIRKWPVKQDHKPVARVVHVERKPRPSINDNAHKALAASLKGHDVDYLPTPRERAI